jgi:knotted carbamoyltransferase YgeW
MKTLEFGLKDLEKISASLYRKDVLLTWERTQAELETLMIVAEALKTLYEENISTRPFASGIAVSQFRDNSTRTRFSFASAANLLGLAVQDLDEGKSQIAHGETVRETSNMISFLTEVIGIRDDIFLGAGHTYMQEVASSLDSGFEDGILHQRPTVVNLQSDLDHPTQSLADLMHLKKVFGSLENLRGKKIAMSWAYSPSYGKPLSVPQGIIGLMSRFGMDLVLAHPEGYSLVPEIVEVAKKNSTASGGQFKLTHSMDEAFENADIVYPKSWAAFRVMQKRTELLQNNQHDALKELEKECLAQNAHHKDWECTEAKMRLTRNGSALYMHCLPADISGVSCKEGEVQDRVFDKYRNETYKEAGFKPFVIAAMILAGRFQDPRKVLSDCIAKKEPRVRGIA